MFHSKPVRNVEVVRSTNVYNIRTYYPDRPTAAERRPPACPTDRASPIHHISNVVGGGVLYTRKFNSFYDLLVFVGKNNLDFMILNLAIT